MTDTCPKCGAPWTGSQYACGSTNNPMYRGFTQSEECLAKERAPEFEVVPSPGDLPAPDAIPTVKSLVEKPLEVGNDIKSAKSD